MEPVQYMARTRFFYEAQGFDRAYAWAHHEEVPVTARGKPLADCVLGVVTTAALYERHATDPRYVAHASTAEPPLRLWANDLSWD